MNSIPFPKRRVNRAVALAQLSILERAYPDAATALIYHSPFELLIAVILSAQCTDARVNLTTPQLFARYPTPQALGAAHGADVERLVKSCGFYRMKAKHIVSASRDLVKRFGGEVPATREALESLAGVGRKTASVVLAVAFQEPAFAVDTHVFRVAHRLGLTTGTTPAGVERDVTALLPRERWTAAHHWLILHGRAICKAPMPQCSRCPVSELCPSAKIVAKTAAGRNRKGVPAAAVRRSALHV
ncbi:MAG: endonuclease III [Vulcanimicrobiaceae bacterium]